MQPQTVRPPAKITSCFATDPYAKNHEFPFLSPIRRPLYKDIGPATNPYRYKSPTRLLIHLPVDRKTKEDLIESP